MHSEFEKFAWQFLVIIIILNFMRACLTKYFNKSDINKSLLPTTLIIIQNAAKFFLLSLQSARGRILRKTNHLFHFYAVYIICCIF